MNYGIFEDSNLKIIEISFSTTAVSDMGGRSMVTGKRILFPENAEKSDAIHYIEQMKESGVCSM